MTVLIYALNMYGIAAVISFFVALLIKGMAWLIQRKNRPVVEVEETTTFVTAAPALAA